MTPEQLAYIAGRRRQIRYWPWLAAVIVALVAGFYAWLWSAAPHNLNTALVLQEFHAKTLAHEDLVMLAARGTLALIGCGLFVLVLVLLVSIALWNESRLLALLDATGATASAPPAAGEAAPGADPAADAADAADEAGAAGTVADGPAAEGEAVAGESAPAAPVADADGPR